MVKIMDCNCKHKYQDKEYGKGKRVFNKIGIPAKHGGNNWRCTVCAKEDR